MMTAGFVRAITRSALLGTVGALFICPQRAGAQEAPAAAQIDLSVVIRDFSRDHPDFNVIPSDGYGYYAGNVGFDLDGEGKPVFAGAGFKVQSLWRNAGNQPIAPHLFNLCGFVGTPPDDGGDDDGGENDGGPASFGLVVDQSLSVEKYGLIDSFDSGLGPYGDENSGESAVVMVNGERHHKYYVTLKKRSKVKGDVLVHPDDEPARAIRLYRKSEITGVMGNMESPAEITGVELPELPEELKVDDSSDDDHKGKHHGWWHRHKRDRDSKKKYNGGTHEVSESTRFRELTLRRRAVMTLQGDILLWCDEDLELEDRSVLNIEGHVTIVCGDELKLEGKSDIRLGDDASLTVYVGRKVEVDRGSRLNMNTGNPQLVAINLAGGHDSKMEIDDRSQVAAWVRGADAYLKVDDRSELFGAFMGRKVKIDDASRFHVDMYAGGTSDEGDGASGDDGGSSVVLSDPEECDLGDIAGSYGVPSPGDVLSADTFYEWWRNVLGINMQTVGTISLVRDTNGTYSFINDDYRPIDGQLLGNEGELHNYHFTLEIDATFTYDAAGAQWVEFRGTDDMYLFINGRLVMDLGGYGYNKVQYLDLDRLGLPDGEPARFQLFHAQRQRGLGIFRLMTNVVLSDGAATTSVNAVLDD